MGTPQDAKRLSFVGTVSTSGRDKVVVVIPKELHAKAKPFQGKALKITIEEIPLET